MAIVYVDVVFVLNVIIDYLLLYATNKVLKKDTSKLIILCGAVVGGFYTVIMLFVDYSLLSSIVGKLLFSSMLVILTFGRMKFKGFIRAFLMFYFVNFAFCGAIYALAGLVGITDRRFTFGVFSVYSVIAYIFLIAEEKYRTNILTKHKVKITVGFNGEEKELNCIVDTGNSLSTPFTQRPVIVAEQGEFGDAFNEFPNDNICINPIIIPFRSVGCDNGVIYGFRPDYAFMESNGKRKELSGVVIGLYKGRLSTDGNYNGLINPGLVEYNS